jgi:hypothetical protein
MHFGEFPWEHVKIPASYPAVALFILIACALFGANEGLRRVAASISVGELTEQIPENDRRRGRSKRRGRPWFIRLEMLAWMPIAFCLFRLYFSSYRNPAFIGQYATIYLLVAVLFLMLFASFLWLGKTFFISAFESGGVAQVRDRGRKYMKLTSIVLVEWIVVAMLLAAKPPGS